MSKRTEKSLKPQSHPNSLDLELGTHWVWETKDEEETLQLGRLLGAALPRETLVCLFGELGAGKTTLTKGIVSAATGTPQQEISSPTFTYLNIYSGEKNVYHFDLYRLDDPEGFFDMGFDEYFQADGICCMEWSERLGDELPRNRFEIHLAHGARESERTIELRRISDGTV